MRAPASSHPQTAETIPVQRDRVEQIVFKAAMIHPLQNIDNRIWFETCVYSSAIQLNAFFLGKCPFRHIGMRAVGNSGFFRFLRSPSGNAADGCKT